MFFAAVLLAFAPGQAGANTGTVWPTDPSHAGKPPLTTNGILAFVTPKGFNGRCSASVVNSPGRSLLVTAAHCLYNFNDRRWTIPMEVHFVAGYHRGEYREHSVGKSFAISPNDLTTRAPSNGPNTVPTPPMIGVSSASTEIQVP